MARAALLWRPVPIPALPRALPATEAAESRAPLLWKLAKIPALHSSMANSAGVPGRLLIICVCVVNPWGAARVRGIIHGGGLACGPVRLRVVGTSHIAKSAGVPRRWLVACPCVVCPQRIVRIVGVGASSIAKSGSLPGRVLIVCVCVAHPRLFLGLPGCSLRRYHLSGLQGTQGCCSSWQKFHHGFGNGRTSPIFCGH